MANGYTTLNLPTELIEDLKVWRMAFCVARGKNFTYAEMIKELLQKSDEDVIAEYNRILSLRK